MVNEKVVKELIEKYKNEVYLYCEEQGIDPKFVTVTNTDNKLDVVLDTRLSGDDIVKLSKKCKELELELFSDKEEEDDFFE